MEAGRRLYNATLGEGLRRHALLKQSKAWQRAREITNKKARSDEFRRLSKEYGFTPAAFITFARQCKNQAGWKDRIGSDVAQRIAEKVFATMEQYTFGKRGRPRFKGANRPLRSLEGTCDTANIIWKRELGCVKFGNLILPRDARPSKQRSLHAPGARSPNQVLSCTLAQRQWQTPVVFATHAGRHRTSETHHR